MRHIYPTSPDPHFCAMALDDKTLDRSIKDGIRTGARTITHFGGVSVYASGSDLNKWDVWTRETYSNMSWFLSHLIYMSTEWKSRGERGWHPEHGLILDLAKQRQLVPDKGPQTMFPNCTAYQNLLDPMVAYRLHLSVKWAAADKPPVWGKAGVPPWIVKPSDLQRIMEKLECN